MSPAEVDDIVAWEDCVTDLPLGFTALHLQASRMRIDCSPEQGLVNTGVEAQMSRTRDAVHLLCRALRLAPPCYCHFLLAADRPDERLTVTGSVFEVNGYTRGTSGGRFL